MPGCAIERGRPRCPERSELLRLSRPDGAVVARSAGRDAMIWRLSTRLDQILDEMVQQEGAIARFADLNASFQRPPATLACRRLRGLHSPLVGPNRAHATLAR